MADRRIQEVGRSKAASPIELIARAELARAERRRESQSAEAPPSLVPPSDTHRPKGLARVLDNALGRVELPTLVDLHAALGQVAAKLSITEGEADPLAAVTEAVLSEEQDKIRRYLSLRDR